MSSYFLSALIVAASLIGKNEQSDSATAAKHNPAPQKGWVALFDGKTTKGWHTYGKNSVSDSWKVDNGTLHLTVSDKEGSHGGGDIVTDEEFSNYHLKLDWKIAPGGNSGIIFFVKEDPAKFPNTYNSGMEMQVLDNEGHPDAKIHKHRAGDLYDLIACSKETVKPAGEWNHAEIVSNNGKLDLFLNGTKVVSTTMWDDNWKKMIAGSKFAKMPGFGTFTSGKIALQDHGNEVWYKNIMIKRL